MIAGIDEVGRGPWAGPLVVGAVVLNGVKIDGLTDSKKISKTKREYLYHQLVESKAAIGLGWVHSEELDQIGLSQSLVEATKRALSEITIPYHEIIIDGTINFLKDTSKGKYVTTIKKADLLVPSVSAASIVAKVARDEYMTAQAAVYPMYGFDSHVGYGTKMHRNAIEKNGISPLHRKTFGPLKSAKELIAYKTLISKPTPTQIGNSGEDAAYKWLEQNNFNIIDRNWKTKLCEIDMIAFKDSIYYFIEVKHRTVNSHGDGRAAITAKKLNQMQFAARIYLHFNKISSDARLVVMTTSGKPPIVGHYLEIG